MEGFSATLALDLTQLRGLRHALSSWLERSGASTADQESMVLATHEAAAHAIEAGESGGTVEVTADRDSDHSVVVHVRHHSRWRPPDVDEHGPRLTMLADIISDVSTQSSTTLRLRQGQGVET